MEDREAAACWIPACAGYDSELVIQRHCNGQSAVAWAKRSVPAIASRASNGGHGGGSAFAHPANTRPGRRRQEVDVVLGRHRHHVLRLLLLHVVKAPEQVVEFSRRCHPEQHLCGLVRLVEDAVRRAHAEPGPIARGCLRLGAAERPVVTDSSSLLDRPRCVR